MFALETLQNFCGIKSIYLGQWTSPMCMRKATAKPVVEVEFKAVFDQPSTDNAEIIEIPKFQGNCRTVVELPHEINAVKTLEQRGNQFVSFGLKRRHFVNKLTEQKKLLLPHRLRALGF